ncbi:hypothetical protein E2C01_070443 [Portunus trituberculatus]|uniref:Uncharacterized protein n=1 Tax=Portunus trituberculatus TaxID=210409 RepID=A0A5B7HXB6_PORTR|nr:hypothetical protein [Portunus trituberculatus]
MPFLTHCTQLPASLSSFLPHTLHTVTFKILQDSPAIAHPRRTLWPSLTPHTNIYSIARHPPTINITHFCDADPSMRADCPAIKRDLLPRTLPPYPSRCPFPQQSLPSLPSLYMRSVCQTREDM